MAGTGKLAGISVASSELEGCRSKLVMELFGSLGVVTFRGLSGGWLVAVHYILKITFYVFF